EVAQGLQFGASGYDAFGNEISGITFDWDTSGGIGSVTATGMFTAGTAVSSGMVTASFGSVSESSSIDVTPGPLHHIDISPTNGTLVVDEDLQFTAQGYDEYDNPIGGLSFVWTTSGSIGTVTSAGLLTAGSLATEGQVTVSSNGLATLADIVVNPGPLHHMAISPSSATMIVDDTLQFTVQGFDVYDNVIEDLTFTWEVAQDMGSLSTTTGSSIEFTAQKDGTCTLTTTSNGKSASIEVEIIEEEEVAPSDWYVYLPIGFIVGLIIGILISTMIRGKSERLEEPEELEQELEEEELEEAESEIPLDSLE
ncbi:MAG: hypothetical protein KAW09_04275, partial [Thermoplasmata archaeon]|nr:hypothetical protein [Thermoplasmata archaeon]